MKKNDGFTLVEILIALFIFSILSVLLIGALQLVIRTEAQTEQHAKELQNLQMTLFMMSRDIEQAINRPVLNEHHKEDAALIGSPHQFTLTHLGFTNPFAATGQSHLQRSRYRAEDHQLWRGNGLRLDQSSESPLQEKRLLQDVEVQFAYLDENNHFQANWPSHDQKEPLPKAIQITLTTRFGNITQLYLLPHQVNKNVPATNH